ncbi:hypothetical protein BFP97_05785 [Roseivirga sp. 4D4]|uniref:DUF998 domain-containing protein n=1 Tax=Roseivirga sp. 4D4 TaxID=1889784 RepID=UPI000853DA96|nr:DUF998 domain-containing protein [Roseivirga sp. 4D4]OEK01047.1 hypothetical protein BFP97_05785 [Roseivirga sp. 4D4]
MKPATRTDRLTSNTAVFGIASFTLFLSSIIIFGLLNPTFNFLDDVISKLGAYGQPNALWWNIIGFVMVGILLIGFGISFGKVLNDRLTGLLLALFGLGFTLTSVPIDLGETDTTFSKAHVVAICLALAFWLFGLARISGKASISKNTKLRANVAAIILVLSMIGGAINLFSMPITHRLVFGVVFGWTFVTSLHLLKGQPKQEDSND